MATPDFKRDEHELLRWFYRMNAAEREDLIAKAKEIVAAQPPVVTRGD